MYSTAVPYHSAQYRVLGDTIPGARWRSAVLVVGGALLTVLGAQISIPLPNSPVPITGQTLAVVIAGASLGAWRGFSSQLLYLLMGLFLPVYSNGGQGWQVIFGVTGGFLVAFPIVAGIMGFMAERGADRKPIMAIITFAVGQLIIFGIGVPWLKLATGMEWQDALEKGFLVFIPGGIIKALLGGLATPLAWKLVRRFEGSRQK
jgi:biotin transport system substrate-specific component